MKSKIFGFAIPELALSLVAVGIATGVGIMAYNAITNLNGTQSPSSSSASSNADSQLGNSGCRHNSDGIEISGSCGAATKLISAGNGYTCSVANGKAYCWGDNSLGELGVTGGPVPATGGGDYGVMGKVLIPLDVYSAGALFGKTVTAISASHSTISAGGDQAITCAIASGKAYCWGDGMYGQLGSGIDAKSYIRSYVPVAVDTSGVLKDKTVTAISANAGNYSNGSSNTFVCAIADGKAYCWGENNYGQLGNGTTTTSYVPVAVDNSGVLKGKTITAISGGNDHACAIADGKAYCWGGSHYFSHTGKSDLGSGEYKSSAPVAVDTSGVLKDKTVTAISASDNYTCAIADGKAYCWGDNSRGQLGNGTTTASDVPVAVISPDVTTRVVSRPAASITPGNIRPTPAAPDQYVTTPGVLAGKTVTAISASNEYACAIADGQAYCWGDDRYGQFGSRTRYGSLASYVPVAVDTSGALKGKIVTAISAGNRHVCTVASGHVYCWGDNSYGQLGNGAETASGVPVATKIMTAGGQLADW